MSPETERLIRESWAVLEPRCDTMVAVFYERLFEIAPEVRPLFSMTDLDALHQKFVHMLREIVLVLDDPSRLVAETAASGRRHVYYEADPRAYDLVGSALLWAIAKELGPTFTPEVRYAPRTDGEPQEWSRAPILTATIYRISGCSYIDARCAG